jgi:hypothetical protein
VSGESNPKHSVGQFSPQLFCCRNSLVLLCYKCDGKQGQQGIWVENEPSGLRVGTNPIVTARKKAASGSPLRRPLVAGGGFEPPTFGL